MYKDRWSDRVTWAGEPPPFEGESVVIPAGQHILYDLKTSPKLALILVEGALSACHFYKCMFESAAVKLVHCFTFISLMGISSHRFMSQNYTCLGSIPLF